MILPVASVLQSLLDPSIAAPILGGGGLLGLVGAKFKQLDTEVRECRKRDSDVVIVLAGVQLLVGKMKRDHPDSIELQMFSDLCGRRLGPPPSVDDLSSLLNEIDRVDEKKRDRHDPR